MTYSKIQNILPGLGLSVAVAIAAIGIERVEEHYAGRAWLEALVIRIVSEPAQRNVREEELADWRSELL